MRAPFLSSLDAFDAAVAIARERAQARIPLLAVAGAQGAGKSSLLREAHARDSRIAGFSLDDVYLGSAERRRLAREIHPLFETRGAPGTHDLALLERTLASLEASDTTRLPSFDKAADERRPEGDWPVFIGRPSLIVVEGWCMGALPQPAEALQAPINPLEAEEDTDCAWRAYANEQLSGPYAAVFARFDAVLFLKAPGFEVVQSWRLEQEEEVLGRALTKADASRINRFIQHFERITRWMLSGGMRADVTAQLDQERRVVEEAL